MTQFSALRASEVNKSKGDWGLGIRDWGLGFQSKNHGIQFNPDQILSRLPQYPVPTPQYDRAHSSHNRFDSIVGNFWACNCKNDNYNERISSEEEPNNSFATRQFLLSGISTVNGELESKDTDFFSFSGLNPGSLFTAEITSESFDPLLGWLDDSGNIVAINDDKADNSVLPVLTGKVPTSGSLNLAVTGLRDTKLVGDHFVSGSYKLSLNTFTLPEPSPNATVLNGGFETGDFTGWTTLGETSIETAAFGTVPTEGTHQALLSTAGTTFADSIIEEFLGLEAGSLDNLSNQNATAGSAIRQTFTAKAGDILSVDWNFLTNERVPPSFNDFSFVSISGLSELADTFLPSFVTSMTPFIEETGFQTFSFTIPTTGTYSLGLGVIDTGDNTIDSGLLVDNVTLTSF